MPPLASARNHQAVPRRQNLVVEVRSRARVACRHQQVARLPQRPRHLGFVFAKMPRRLLHRVRGEQNILSSELVVRVVGYVAVPFHSVAVRELGGALFPQQLLELLPRPYIERPFRFFVRIACVGRAVGILGGIERAFRSRHVAQHVIENPPRRARQCLVARDLEGIQIGSRQLRLVVEHLFEMRHEPRLVH